MLTLKVLAKYAIMKAIKILLLVQLALLGIAIPAALVARRLSNVKSGVLKEQEQNSFSDHHGHGLHPMEALHEWVGDDADDAKVSTETSWSWSTVWNAVGSVFFGKTIIQTFAWNQIHASMVAWGRLAEAVMDSFTSFFQWMSDFFKTYERLKDEALTRYNDLNDEVEELTLEHQQLVQMCLQPADEATRSKCIDSFLVIHDRLKPLRRQRRRAHNQYIQYEKYHERSKSMREKVSEAEM